MAGQFKQVQQYQFGEYPIHLTVNEDTSVYSVNPQEQQLADECIVDMEFSADRLEVMQNRAAAYGYVLVIEEAAQ